MILNFLLNIQRMIWMIFAKTLKSTTQTRNVNYSFFFYDMIADVLNNKNFIQK